MAPRPVCPIYESDIALLLPHCLSPPTCAVTRSQNNITKPKHIVDCLAKQNPIITPITAKKAQKHPQWRDAMKHELDA